MASYLRCLGQPYEEFLCGTSLKTGVIIIGIVDVVFAIFRLFEIPPTIDWFNSAPIPIALILLSHVIDIIIGLIAILGLVGITKLNEAFLNIYSVTKSVYIFLRTGLISAIILIMILFSQSLNSLDKLLISSVFFFAIAYNIPAGKYVWSTYIRVRNSEHLLVIYGKETMILLQNRNQLNRSNVYATRGIAVPSSLEDSAFSNT